MPSTMLVLPGSLRAILAGAVDYAGLFPPASLDLARAAAEYEAYRTGPDAWALGRFVLPASRLAELGPLVPSDVHGAPWSVSALVSSIEADSAAIRDFNRAMRERAVVDAVEARTPTAADVESLATLVSPAVEVYCELPREAEIEAAVGAIAAIGARAKIRTGGVTPDAFPTTAQVLRVLRACHELGVPFKATAGLHHPLRGRYPLTYDAGAPRGDMYGYVNLILGAVLLWMGEDEATVTAMFDERDRRSLHFGDDAVRWQGHTLSVADIAQARAVFVRGFGACSF
ncbi:MAG TPA: hypothetical protein VF178_06060, partial [Gemmatimonadaceae bacterium]